MADSRPWLPSADELLASVPGDPARVLAELARLISQHVRMDAATHQLCLWRHAVKNPLTARLTADWKELWKELPVRLGAGLDYEARQNWEKACALLALATEAGLMDEAIDLSALDALSNELVAADVGADSPAAVEEDRLPTNLL